MKLFKAALLVSTLALSLTAVAAPAMARSSVSIDFGNIALGYRDGYYDNGHRYHHWDRRKAEAYRTRYNDNYRDMRHNHDHNRSWNR